MKIRMATHLNTITSNAGDQFNPKFLKQYADMAHTMKDAFKHYIDDVKDGKFPTLEQSYN